MNAAIPSFSRARRTWLWDFGNGVPTEGGLIAAAALFSSHTTNRHNYISPGSVIGTIAPQIVGQAVGGAGSACELMISLRKGLKLRRLQLNRKQAIARAFKVKNDVDTEISAYEKENLGTNGQVETESARQLELRLLRNIETHSLFELKNALATNNRQRYSEAIEDSVSLTRNTIGGIGNSINVYAIGHNNKRLNGRGAILNLIAASMITARPLITNFALFRAEAQNNSDFDKRFGILPGKYDKLEAEADFKKDLRDLQKIAGNDRRLAFYSAQAAHFAMLDDFDKANHDTTKQKLLRRFRESLYGPTKIAQSTCGIVVGLRSQKNTTLDNRVEAGANITYMSGQAFNLLELSRERIVDERHHAKLKGSANCRNNSLKNNCRRSNLCINP